MEWDNLIMRKKNVYHKKSGNLMRDTNEFRCCFLFQQHGRPLDKCIINWHSPLNLGADGGLVPQDVGDTTAVTDKKWPNFNFRIIIWTTWLDLFSWGGGQRRGGEKTNVYIATLRFAPVVTEKYPSWLSFFRELAKKSGKTCWAMMAHEGH